MARHRAEDSDHDELSEEAREDINESLTEEYGEGG